MIPKGPLSVIFVLFYYFFKTCFALCSQRSSAFLASDSTVQLGIPRTLHYQEGGRRTTLNEMSERLKGRKTGNLLKKKNSS